MGVQSQLSTLSQVIRTIDPKLHQHLGMIPLCIPIIQGLITQLKLHFLIDRGTRWWGVFICIPHADGTVPKRVFLCGFTVSLGGEEENCTHISNLVLFYF